MAANIHNAARERAESEGSKLHDHAKEAGAADSLRGEAHRGTATEQRALWDKVLAVKGQNDTAKDHLPDGFTIEGTAGHRVIKDDKEHGGKVLYDEAKVQEKAKDDSHIHRGEGAYYAFKRQGMTNEEALDASKSVNDATKRGRGGFREGEGFTLNEDKSVTIESKHGDTSTRETYQPGKGKVESIEDTHGKDGTIDSRKTTKFTDGKAATSHEDKYAPGEHGKRTNGIDTTYNKDGKPGSKTDTSYEEDGKTLKAKVETKYEYGPNGKPIATTETTSGPEGSKETSTRRTTSDGKYTETGTDAKGQAYTMTGNAKGESTKTYTASRHGYDIDITESTPEHKPGSEYDVHIEGAYKGAGASTFKLDSKVDKDGNGTGTIQWDNNMDSDEVKIKKGSIQGDSTAFVQIDPKAAPEVYP